MTWAHQMAWTRQRLRARMVQALSATPSRRRYGRDLKRDVAAYVQAWHEATGDRISKIARELRVSKSLIDDWIRHARRRWAQGKVPFEPVERPPLDWLARKRQ